MDTFDQFIHACEGGAVERVREIVSDRDFDVNHVKCVYVSSGLINAVAANKIDVVRLLLSHPNIDVNAGNSQGFSPLQYAIRHANTIDLEIIKMLLAHPNIDVNKYDVYGDVCLMDAVVQKSTEIVRLLLEHPKIDVTVETYRGWTLLDLATGEEDNEAIVNLLRAHMGMPAESEILPMMSVPPNTDDTISYEMIENGTPMVDFHGEREFGRYYTAASYKALCCPKRNPMTRQLILKSDVVYYIADVATT